MNNPPLVSVIVPVYNAEKTLRQCIDSILSQENQDFELLLMDDGSKDASPSICDEYAGRDGRIHVCHKKNGGVSSARNLGLDLAKGEWVTFIDSDDEISEHFLTIPDVENEEVIIKGYVKRNGDVIAARRLFRDAERECELSSFLSKFLVDSIIRGPWAKFYRRIIIGNLRFHPDMRIGEDACFVFDYLQKCNTCFLSGNGYYIFTMSGVSDEVKYAISVEYAVLSLNYLKEAFLKLSNAHGLDRRLFLPYINYFKCISKNDWGKTPSKWWGNKDIRANYRYVWPDLTMKQKIRLIGARLQLK